MRRYHALLGAVLVAGALLLTSAVSRAASVTVRVESAEAAAGEQAEIPITVAGSPGMVAMHLELTYDPGILQVETVDPGAMLEGNALLEFNTEEVGRLVIGFAAAEEIEGDGTLATARFQVSGEEGQTTTLDVENGRAWDEIGVDIIVNGEAGEFKVAEGDELPWLLILGCLGALFVVGIIGAIVVLVVVLSRRGRQT